MGGAQGLAERITSSYESLSPQEQRVADLIRDRGDDVALYNSTELARLSGVSKATVSRLFRRLGFAGSHEVRDLLRAERSAGVPVVVDPMTEPTGGIADRFGRVRPSDVEVAIEAQLRTDHDNLARLYAGLDPAILRSVVAALAQAERVLVIGFRSASPVALQLRQQLAQVREGVSAAPQAGQSIAEELAGFGPKDAVVVIGFRRRPAGFPGIVAAVADTGAAAVLITDPSGGRHGDAFRWVIECPIEAASAFDSYAAAMSLVSLIAGGVLGARGADGRTRVTSISAGYTRLGELEPT